MSDDIVARLRVWIDQASQQGVEEAVKGLTMAADTIERLDAKAFALEYENERLRAEVERLRAGGCSRGQTTTQFCAEAERLRNELAARCGIGGAGAHTAGPTETFIPEAL